MSDFASLWRGGYFEGDPLDPKASSSYSNLSYMSILHATYLRCIKPYLNTRNIALEIGSGRGAWTKCLLPFKEVHVLEVITEEEAGICEYLQNPANLMYHKLEYPIEAIPLEDEYIDYMFSFGCMCHLPFWMLQQYASLLYPKMRHKSNCFWMISSYEKAGFPPDKNEEPTAGRWYDNSLPRTCEMLEEIGYSIFDRDVGTNLRDPIIWFGRR